VLRTTPRGPRARRWFGAAIGIGLAAAAITSFAPTSSADPSPATASGRTAYGWGNNATGELADGTTTTRLSPVGMLGLSGATAMSTGEVHGLAIVGGSVVGWGHNRSGQIGDGSTADRTSPVPVAGLSNVVNVSAGNAFSLAVTADGSVYAWGNNESGESGDGTAPADHLTPVRVTGLGPGSGVVAVAAGGSQALALRSDGAVFAWGNNASGQVGDGTTATRTTPVAVNGLGPGSGVVAIAAGGAFSLALKSNGAVVAWGNNESGQLGDGTAPTDRLKPVAVAGLGAGSGVVKIVAGGASSYALHSNGTLSVWGNNGAGELGDGLAPTDVHTPKTLSGLPRYVDVAAGDQHALALASDGSVWAFGDNALGQIGDGTLVRRPTAVAVMGLGAGSGISAVYAGGTHSHALTGAAGTPATPPATPGVPGAPKATAVSADPTLTG
jgi:alpha-tubulin suppressor-like RCC1 family protein